MQGSGKAETELARDKCDASLLPSVRTIEGLEAAVVLSTHDVNLAYEFATDVVVLLDGRLTVGSCDHILSDTELLRKARLELPWAPVVSVALGRTVKRPEDVL